MQRRKLLTSLLVAGVLSGTFGAVMPASAVERSLVVTLMSGRQVPLSVDVPPGTPVEQIPLPAFDEPVVGVVEIGAPPADPGPAPTPDMAVSGPAAPGSGAPSPAPGQPAGESGVPAVVDGEQQATSGKAKRGRSLVDAAAERASGADRPDAGLRSADGAPTNANPALSLVLPGAAPIGVPNFMIERFRIPPFLLSIYQAAGIQYGVRWEVLAAINEIETDYGRNLNISSAGALGWMQFMPATWKMYGVDANGDDRKDPYNPVDAIFAAARYLKAAGADQDLRKAIFAYNHADWYVESVLLRAEMIGGLPSDLVGSLTGLTQGQFPVAARARYADDISEREAQRGRRAKTGQSPSWLVQSAPGRRGLSIFARRDAPVIAVQDGRIESIGTSKRLGRYIRLRDVYGNAYTYAHLGEIAAEHPVPKRRSVTKAEIASELELPSAGPKPSAPATAGKPTSETVAVAAPSRAADQPVKERLYANPQSAAHPGAGRHQLKTGTRATSSRRFFKSYFSRIFRLDPSDVELRPLRKGSRVIAGTILGRIGKTIPGVAPHVLFEIRPAGRGAPRIDPKPIVDGWKLLESTALYRAAGKNPFWGPDAESPTVGQILLMSKDALERRVLRSRSIELYDCGRRDIAAGRIDRRVLATLELLSASGLRPTVTSLTCGHSYLTSGGNVSHHSSGNAVDIARVNGIPILGHQGEGSIADTTVRRLLTLQGSMEPSQIISLMTYEGTENTLAMADHADHIHVGFQPRGEDGQSRLTNATLKPGQWMKLIQRLSQIDNPTVRKSPSKYALPVKRASRAHAGE